jgi:hypothetical protein
MRDAVGDRFDTACGVAIHQLPTPSHPFCYFRGGHEVLFTDSQNFGSDLSFTNIMDCAVNRIFE